MRRILILAAVAVLTGTSAAVVTIAVADSEPAAQTDPRLAFLKSLEGTWVSESSSDDLHEGIFEYRVTSGGTTVEERLMVGSPHEMLTIYHMDGRDLIANHFCMLDNQPRFTASRRVDDGTLVFDCDGKVSNTASHDEQHIHNWTMTLADDGTLRFTATMTKDGEVVEQPVFVLARR